MKILQRSDDSQHADRFIEVARIQYGIKMASAVFQRTIEQIIENDMENILCYQDDICIGTRNKLELKNRTEIMLKKIKKCVNGNKPKICVHNSSEI